MPNPWLSIPLGDYEGHMSAAHVQQLSALSELFREVVERCEPLSVAILGVAGGNGLEHLAAMRVGRIVGLDVNPRYLDETRRRHDTLAGLELHCVDLARDEVRLEPVALVHAAMVFEHAGLERALDNSVDLVAPGGWLSVVLQLPSSEADAVAPTPFTSVQSLAEQFVLIDVDAFRTLLANRGFVLHEEWTRRLPGGKAFWMGAFSRG